MNYLTAGESHGPQLTGILEGIPAGLHLDVDQIDQPSAGRSPRRLWTRQPPKNRT